MTRIYIPILQIALFLVVIGIFGASIIVDIVISPVAGSIMRAGAITLALATLYWILLRLRR